MRSQEVVTTSGDTIWEDLEDLTIGVWGCTISTDSAMHSLPPLSPCRWATWCSGNGVGMGILLLPPAGGSAYLVHTLSEGSFGTSGDPIWGGVDTYCRRWGMTTRECT
jgi:hypothetical protein